MLIQGALVTVFACYVPSSSPGTRVSMMAHALSREIRQREL